jgi:nitrile hydratase accessory protein
LNLRDLPSIPRDDDGPVFAEAWQAQAFAMVLTLNERGLFTWKEWSDTLAAEIRENPGEYYEQWLSALEHLVERKALMSHEEREARIDEWDRAAHATPHGQPIELSRVRRDPETSPEASKKSPGERRSGT